MVGKVGQTDLSWYKNYLDQQKTKPKKAFVPKEDPLMKYPTRGLAYANEVGVAIAPMVKPIISTLFWAPALMYFGADIYDKYQQGKEGDYSKPSTRKAVTQTTFQALASVLLPTASIMLGQKATNTLLSKFAKKEELNLFTKLELLEKVKKNYGEFSGKNQEGISKALNKLIDSAKADNKLLSKNQKFFQKAIGWLVEWHPAMEQTLNTVDKAKGDMTNVTKFVEKAVKDMDAVKANLEKGTKKVPFKKIAQKAYWQVAKAPLAIKVAGGFAALFMAVRPIDHFVEHIVIKKGLDPALDRLERNIK